MNNMINVFDEDGNQFEVEVLDIFTVAGYEDKEYILYTRNKAIDENNIEVMVSILRENNGQYYLDNIEDDKEWETVQFALDENGDV